MYMRESLVFSVLLVVWAFALPCSAQITSLREAAIETFAAKCLEAGDEDGLWHAGGQWDSLFAEGYTADQILMLAEAIPEDCGFHSFDFAIHQMAEEGEIKPGDTPPPDDAEEIAAEASTEATEEDTPRDEPEPAEPEAPEPVATSEWHTVDLHEPAGFGTGGRLLGMGTFLGFGYGYNSTFNVMSHMRGVGSHFDVQLPGFEFRVFPTDRFSFDFLFQIGNLAWAKAQTDDRLFLLMMFGHIYAVEADLPRGRLNFSIAPGIVAMTNLEYTKIGAFGGGLRVGIDAMSDDDVFGFGVYVRPLFYVIKEQYGKNYGNFEMLLEFTWTWYVPRPPGA